jgi:hypothetical protein
VAAWHGRAEKAKIKHRRQANAESELKVATLSSWRLNGWYLGVPEGKAWRPVYLSGCEEEASISWKVHSGVSGHLLPANVGRRPVYNMQLWYGWRRAGKWRAKVTCWRRHRRQRELGKAA